ncbi:Actin cytoskeleton-regulatory complex pan1 [Gossypium arboreum]|uniref:Actin cytoskeleton-regulatory complex pan1 n=1 Tax=Gossypium arboreum TaxID=29729 RepID=A0A0B0NV67_GOSAR|nr:Actin cytoskeleton-regulatory complex pan1 [Gossypium arboreum]
MYEAVSACLECPKPITENSTLITSSYSKHPGQSRNTWIESSVELQHPGYKVFTAILL